jgi:hypothetical protein
MLSSAHLPFVFAGFFAFHLVGERPCKVGAMMRSSDLSHRPEKECAAPMVFDAALLFGHRLPAPTKLF